MSDHKEKHWFASDCVDCAREHAEQETTTKIVAWLEDTTDAGGWGEGSRRIAEAIKRGAWKKPPIA